MKHESAKGKMKALFILILSVVLVALTACQSSNNEKNAASPSASAGSASNTTPSTPGKSDKVVQLEFLQFAAPVAPAFNAMIKKFEEKYPNIKIKQTNVAEAGKVLDMRMASGDAPDLFNLGPNASYRNFVKNGLVVDLTNASFMKRLKPEALKIVEVNGKQYGMPGVFNMIAMYYNTKIFNDLGISVPKTKDELMAAAEKIKAAGITPFAFPDKDMPMINGLDFQAYTGVYSDNPRQIFQDAVDKKAHLTESGALRKAAQLYVDLRKYSGNSLSMSMEEGFNQFASGKVAMIPYINFAAGAFKGINPKLEFAQFPIPGDDPAQTRIPLGVGFMFAISSDSKYIEEAKLFLDFWAQPENAAFFESMDLAPSAIINAPSTIKETALIREHIQQGKIFRWPGEGLWSSSQTNDFASHAQFLAQSKDVDKFLKSIDALFYGVK